ncbi:MAG: nucleotide exchange factor GrpE, partial [Chloroflexi bacterium]|nr:nucleotide exchange factor GrpE [Chloroflexota bacterium]
PDHDSNQIVSETQKGYRLGDRVLRCSKVVVAK